MKRGSQIIAGLLLGGFIAAQLGAQKGELLGIELVWKPTEDLSNLKIPPIDLIPFTGKKIVLRAFTDGRSEPRDLIAENHEKADKGIVRKVTTSGNVPAFCQTALKKLFTDFGVPIATEGTGNTYVDGEVLEFFVKEKDSYDGTVKIRVTVSDAKGQPIWMGMALGQTHRFGRSYKAENFYEVLSDSLLQAGGNLLKDEKFLNALAGKK